MNRLMLVVVPLALLSSGCVARVIAPAPRVVLEPAAPPPAVVVTPPPQPVYVTPPPQPVYVQPEPIIVVRPPVLVAPPRVVIVPGTQVYTVPTATYNVFVYGGHYYSYHHGTWFHAPRHGAAWTPVAIAQVPAPVRAVPVKHWRIPPGQERKLEKAERDRDDDCRGHGRKGKC
jgi:hypothetical protein